MGWVLKKLQHFEERQRCLHDDPVKEDKMGDARPQPAAEFDGYPTGMGEGYRYNAGRLTCLNHGKGILHQITGSEITQWRFRLAMASPVERKGATC